MKKRNFLFILLFGGIFTVSITVFMKNADTKKVFIVNPEALTATFEEGDDYTGCIVGEGTGGKTVNAFYCGTCSMSTIVPNGDGLCRSN